MLLQSLIKANAIHPPDFIADNCHYLTIMGSQAYGVADNNSDLDVYGFAIPPKHILFPHLAGEIQGFGHQVKRFEQYQEHHIKDPTDKHESIDLSVYNIAKYFQLCMENNPNMIDSLFTPVRCVLHITSIGQMVKDNRKMFLHKGAYHKFKGYAYSQLHKMKSQERTGKRKETFDKYGFDIKFAYHLVRLTYEVQMILEHQDLDLEQNREHLKAIRRGDVKEEEVISWFSEKEKYLEKLYETSPLQHSPDEGAIKSLLLNCLEHHYGSLHNVVVTEDASKAVLRKVKELVDSLPL
jgi:predicted nucleotidyltransferase